MPVVRGFPIKRRPQASTKLRRRQGLGKASDVATARRATRVIAEKLRVALNEADLDAFAQLLDPQVRWGAPGDPAPPCQSRQQVLDWYRRGLALGRRARVQEVLTSGDKVFLELLATEPDATVESEQLRWQVLTIARGRVVDIRGYGLRSEAAAAAANLTG